MLLQVAVHCDRVLQREHVHRGRTCRTVRRSKYYGESYIMESLSEKLFVDITYVAGSLSSYLIEIEII